MRLGVTEKIGAVASPTFTQTPASMRGGFTRGREMRRMWTHIRNSRNSGTATCRNTTPKITNEQGSGFFCA